MQIKVVKNRSPKIRFDIITIFPDMLRPYAEGSMLGRGQKNRAIKIEFHALRKFAKDKHKKTDEKAFGGGPGMVMKAEPIIKAVEVVSRKSKSNIKKKMVVFFEPSAKQFDDKTAVMWSKKYEQIIFVCGHYEGIDERVKKMIKDQGLKIETVSIGPYVLTGGELPALVVVDAISRKIEGVLGKLESLEEKRLGTGVPCYTRPAEIKYKEKKYKVPPILLSGHHRKVEEWREKNRKNKK